MSQLKIRIKIDTKTRIGVVNKYFFRSNNIIREMRGAMRQHLEKTMKWIPLEQNPYPTFLLVHPESR